MNNIFKPRLDPEDNRLKDEEEDSFSLTQSGLEGGNHISHGEALDANSHDEQWMRSLASRRKQKKQKQAPLGANQHQAMAVDEKHFSPSSFENNGEDFSVKEPSSEATTNPSKPKKPTLSIGRDRDVNHRSSAKEGRPYWLWLLFSSILILVAAVIALRFLDKSAVEMAGVDKPIISMDNVEWKVRPDDPGGAEIPFENLEIMDTTGNARLLQNQVDLLLPSAEADKPSPYTTNAEDDLEDQVAYLLDAAGQSEDALYDENAVSNVTESPNNTQNRKIAKIVSVPSDIPLIDGSIPAWQVQLSTVFSEKDARAEWQRFARRYGNLILNQPVLISRTGENYALRVGDFDSSRKANELCERIKEMGGDCLLFSPRR